VGIPAAFFVSGAAALILQVLWARLLGHVLGANALAISTVLTVFMGGLALGSWIGGRWAPRIRRPYFAFALLEATVGLYGLAVPALLEGVVWVQGELALDLSPAGYALFRFGMAAGVLAIPTVCMGASLPVLAQGWIRAGEGADQTGHLYAANTFGAVVGAGLGGFWLIPTFGVTSTVWIAAGLDLAVAAGVGLGHRQLARRPREVRPDDLLRAELDSPPERPSARVERWVVATYALTGAFSMALEVLWSRAIGVVIGASTYSFTVILTAYLLGLAAGAAIMTRLIHRVRSVAPWIAATVAGAGLSVVLAHRVIDGLPLALHRQLLERGVTPLDVHWTNFVLALVVTLPSTLCFGALMPLAVRGSERADGPGRTVGRIYAANTLGSIAGSFAGGFVLLPLLGVEWGILALAAGLAGWGAVLAVVTGTRRSSFALAAAAAAAVLAVSAPAWSYARWTAGLFRPYVALGVHGHGWEPHAEVVHHADGVATSVTVDRNPDSGSVALKVNGKVDASDRGDMPTQILSGLVPLLIHPDPASVLVIGYGSGVTPGAVLQSDIERLVVAEIEAEIYEASNRYFGHVNHRPDLDPRAELVVDDGRNFLLTRHERYDVIVSEPSNPWMSGAASLFTRDFFEIAKGRLEPGGVFLQWLQAYELAPRNVEVLLRTFRSVFPHVMMLTPDPFSNDTFLVGSLEPARLDFARLAGWMRHPKLGPELARAGVRQPHDLVALLVAGEEEWASSVPPGPINTDDNALIEFRAPLDLLEYAVRDPSIPIMYRAERRRRQLAARLIENLPDDAITRRRIAESLLYRGRPEDAEVYAKTLPVGAADRARLLRLIGYVTDTDAESALVANDDTRADRAYAEAAWAVVQGRDDQALAFVEQAEPGFEDGSPAHRLLYAYLCYRNDRYVDAEYLLDSVLEDEVFTAKHPEALYYAGRTQLFRGDLDAALEYFSRFDDARVSERL
jgi:spermidine synthase